MSMVLVVDDDAEVAQFIEDNLRGEGYDVQTAVDGAEAMTLIDTRLPDLVLLDVLLPKLDGFEVCRRLRADPATANLPIIMLTSATAAADRVAGLTVGADDCLAVPFDTVELLSRVRATLRRNADNRAASPLTGLPGNHRIDREIAARMTTVRQGGPAFAVCYVDLDNFKAYNDRYGFLRGDEVLTLLASTLRTAAAAAGSPPPFLGHVGGDDFVVVCAPEQAEPLARRALDLFDTAVPALHDAEDAARGYLTLVDRQGNVRQLPMVSVSIGVAISNRRQFVDHREVVEAATEMKTVAKGTAGSAVAVDRRADG